MEWILVFLDTLFGGLVAESEWFDRIAKKFTGSVENLVYRVESGSMDASGLSQKVERLVHWLPIVFLICLALDLLIRSRFVRYSYRDENQAKKSVWWRWQSDADAALALEEASKQAMLPQKASQDAAEPCEPAESEAETLESSESEPPFDETQTNAEESAVSQEDDGIDRGMITDARQNRLHDQSAIAQRAQEAATDFQDRFTIFKSALLFLPKAASVRAQMTKRSVKNARERAAQRGERAPRAISGRDAQAEADAFFSRGMQSDYVDGDYTSSESVSTGGIDDYSFANAAQVIREATGQEDAAAKTAPKKKKPKNLKKRVRITFVGKKPKASDTEPDEAQQKESEPEPTEEKSEE